MARKLLRHSLFLLATSTLFAQLHQFKPALEAYEKFLAMEQGKTSDQIWQAQQRSKVLKHMLEEKR